MRINKFLHDNRNKIVVVIIAIVAIILIIQLLNQNVKKENEIKQQELINSQYIEIPSYGPQIDYSPITNQTLENSTAEQNSNSISVFIGYCNKKEYENAYNILTKECKEELFPTLTDFIEKYCNIIFNEEKTYSLQYEGSISNLDTYNIRIFKNPLITGTYNENSTIEDYYTIVKTDEGDRLNINKYIGRIEIGSKKQTENITITVMYKDIYIDYERYKINVENKTGKTILLNGEQTIGTVYGKDSNDIKYSSFIYELTENEMKIENNFNKNMKIKLNKQYSVGNTLRVLAFTNIILDYEKYKNLEDKEAYGNILSIQIGI